MRRISTKKFTYILTLILLVVFISPILAQQSEVQETILPNGLKVLTKEVRAAPVISFMIWYKVGSMNEQMGKTGLAHLLEHMQFKGTPTFPKGEADRLILRSGGLKNAGTWKDFTFYYATLPSDKLELVAHIESDRMVNSLIDPEEHKAEMTVVRSELEGNENNPDRTMLYELYAIAYKAHPYKFPTIGWRHDVESITRDDIYEFYRTYYHPNNATVVVVGDFDTAEALNTIEQYFGSIHRGPDPPEVTAKEPAQLGERRAEIRRTGAAHRIMMGYHTPEAGHPDIYALDVLDVVLSQGRSSRLYRALVDSQLATSARASSSISKDPNLFRLGATARAGIPIEDVEAAILAEIDKVKSELISDEELQKALNQLEAFFIYSNDSVTDQARQLGYYETIHSWRFIDEYIENARKVTKEDVQRVAQEYLTDKNRTVITFIPESSQAGADQAISDNSSSFEIAAYREETASMSEISDMLAQNESSQAGAPRTRTIEPTRVELPNGMVVIIHENRSNPTIAIRGSLNAGGMLDPQDKKGVANITASLLDKGTSNRSADQISDEKDFVALSIETWAETERASFSGRALSKDFDLLLDLLGDQLRNPIFSQDEFDKMKSMLLSRVKEEDDHPRSLAFRAFYGEVFPDEHPYHRLSIQEEIANIEGITREDVAEFYENHYGPESAVLVIVGDVDTNEAVEKITEYFGDWERTREYVRPEIADTPLQSSINQRVISMPDKSQVEIVLGFSGGIKRSDPEFYPAMVMNFVLGGGGALDSRLGDVLRNEMGLVYSVYSTFQPNLGAGPWFAALGTNPQNVDKAVEALVEQINLIREEGVTEQEMRDAVDYITGSFASRRLETNASIADVLHTAEFHGLGIDFIQRFKELYRSVTLDEVNEIARRYLHPENYTLVIAGPYENDAN